MYCLQIDITFPNFAIVFRTLCFFEIMFQEIILCLESNNVNINMRKIYTTAYEGSVQKYHNWVTQQIFAVSFLVIWKLEPVY